MIRTEESGDQCRRTFRQKNR